MKDIIINISKEKRMVNVSKSFIGNDGENLQGNLIFKFEDEFVDGIARLEYEVKGEKKYAILTKNDEEYNIPIKSVLTFEGQINMQLVITEEERDEGIPIFKSNVFYVYCNKSVNAEIEEPEEYPTWIEIANQKLIEVDKAITEVKEFETKVDELDEKVIEIESNIVEIENDIDDIVGDINEIAVDVDNNSKNITTLANTKADKTDIPDLTDYVKDSNYVHTDNNYTTAEKTKLSKLSNYNDKQIKQEISKLSEEKADKTEIPDVSKFITNTVDNLINYYKKTETYTRNEVNELIGAIKTVSMKVVPERPQKGENNIIYLVPSSKTTTENIYDEYIYVDNKWELIGSTAVDLTNYYTKDEISTLLYDYITSSDLEDTLNDYVTITKFNDDKYNYVKDGLVNNTNTLSDEEKIKIESWLGLDENYLTTYNETPYQVNGNYNPAHKKYVDDNIKIVDDKVKELELFKFPNMTIVGTPTIQNGQVSNFTLDDYLEFPFLVDFRGRPFEINFSFTTGSNVTIQQNILDSNFGLALAIKNGRTLMAISYNGTSWSNQYTGNFNIEPNTTYVYKISWNGMLYKVQYYNGSEYVNDFYFTSTQQPYPKQMFIGVSRLSNNYFEGSINLNYANLIVDGNVVWTGMDDVGISSRLAIDLSNIDEAGVQKIVDIIDETMDGRIPTKTSDLTNDSNFISSTDITKIVAVSEYPSEMEQDVLYLLKED